MINQERFIEGLLQRLVMEDVIHLPSFGVFRCSYKSANIDAMAGQITPPTKEIVFSPLASNTKESLKLIAIDLDISLKACEQFYQALRNTWEDRLRQKEIIQIAGLGRIYKEFSGEIKFKQELLTNIFQNDELPILNFKPISRTKRQKEAIQSKNIKPKKQLKIVGRPKKNVFSLLTSAELLPITIGVASFLIIFVGYLILPKQPNFTNQSLAEKVKVERINKKPSHQLQAELAKDTFIDLLKEEKKLEEEIAAVFQEEKVNQTDSSEQYQNVKRISPKKLRQAIIITGAYQNINGAKRKIKSLVAKGYNPYQDIKLDLHRVGITFSYREVSELQENLLQIQESISPQAWILE